MEIYCGKRKNGEYQDFFKGVIQVKMCGHAHSNIVKVNIVEASDGKGRHYGYKDHNTGEIRFIYGDKRLVEMCSPDGFKSNIANGDGSIVNVNIKEISEEE